MVFTFFKPKKKKDLEHRFATFTEQLVLAFAKIKDDLLNLNSQIQLNKSEMENIKKWLEYLHQNNQNITQNHQKLHTSNKYSAKTLENNQKELSDHKIITNQELENIKLYINQISEQINAHKTDNINFKKKLSEVHENIENTKISMESHISQLKSEALQQKPTIQPTHQSISQPIIAQSYPASSGFERHIISQIRPNRKSYVINFILKLISENNHSTKELENIVVLEKQLCGRTTFYAHLKELKYKDKINQTNVDDKIVLTRN